MLTNTWNYDKVKKLSTNSKSVEKKIRKNLKKFLTNQKQHDMISELLRWGDNKDQQKNIDNWTVKQPWKILKSFIF